MEFRGYTSLYKQLPLKENRTYWSRLVPIKITIEIFWFFI